MSPTPPDPKTWLNHNVGVSLDTVMIIRRHLLGKDATIYQDANFQGGYVLKTTESQYQKIASYLNDGDVIEQGVIKAFTDAGLTAWP